MNNSIHALLTSDNITEFSSTEECEFYEFLKKSPNIRMPAFENNRPYILQSTRNGHYKFSFQDSVVYFTTRNDSESLENFIVIVHFLGAERYAAILEFCNILKQLNIQVLIKNIDVEELGFREKNSFIQCEIPRSKYSFRDDNTFPLHIFSNDTIINQKFNIDYRRLFKIFASKNISTESYDSSYDEIASNLLRSNATFLFSKGVDTEEEVFRAHEFFRDNNVKERIRIQHIQNGLLIGVSYLTKVEDVAFYNALFCQKANNLTKYLLYSGMKYVVENFPKVSYFSIQGSENEGQDFFKKRFSPTFSIHKTHITFK